MNIEAYAEGFCKVAEEAGVDPVALYKQAGFIRGALKLGLKGLGRYTSLLFGGKVRKYDKMLKTMGNRMTRVKDNLEGAGLAGDTAGVKRYGRLMDWLLPRQADLMAQRAKEAKKVMWSRVGGLGAIGLGTAMYGPLNDYFGGDIYTRRAAHIPYDTDWYSGPNGPNGHYR